MQIINSKSRLLGNTGHPGIHIKIPVLLHVGGCHLFVRFIVVGFPIKI